jgi:hypothetical protein
MAPTLQKNENGRRDATGAADFIPTPDYFRTEAGSSLLEEMLMLIPGDNSSYSSGTTDDFDSEESKGPQSEITESSEGAAKRPRPRAKRPRAARAGSSSPRRKPRKLLWRKYGQKVLKGDQKGVVRCYYRCHEPTCPAKRFVEKPATDLTKVLQVRLEEAHTHHVSSEYDDFEDTSQI